MSKSHVFARQIGLNILLARKKAHLSQEEVAEALGVTTDTVGRWERGRVEPKLSTLARIAFALDCHFRDLLPSDLNGLAGGAA